MPNTIIVIGGGPVGVEAALTAARADAAVTLISNAPIGGRAGWHSLLPSKVWLTAADAAVAGSHAGALGLTGRSPTVDPTALLTRLRALRQAWNEEQRQALLDAGVTLLQGSARFADADTLTIAADQQAETTLSADAYIVATGSVPRFPSAIRPDGERILAPRFAAGLDPLPESIIVVGGGATGSEFAYLFHALGARVTWVIGREGILPTFHSDAGAALADHFRARGMTIIAGSDAAGVQRLGEQVDVTLDDGTVLSAGHAFLAIGRRPDLDGLALAAAGLDDGIVPPLDPYCRSSNPRVYVVGDAAGGALMVNKGLAQARTAALHAAGRSPRPWNPASMLFTIYTEPQVAQVGSVDDAASTPVRLPYGAVLKGRLLPEPAGFLQINVDPASGQLLGGVAVGDHAGDLLAPLALAIDRQLRAADLATLYVAHPTLSELLFQAARRAVA